MDFVAGDPISALVTMLLLPAAGDTASVRVLIGTSDSLDTETRARGSSAAGEACSREVRLLRESRRAQYPGRVARDRRTVTDTRMVSKD